MATTTIPTTVAPKAAARVVELGFQADLERMLEHTRLTVPGLRAIDVTLEDDPCPGEDPGVVIWSHREDPGPGDDPTDRQWGEWEAQTFPPEVSQHFCMLSTYGAAAHGR